MVHHYDKFILGWWARLFNLLEVGPPPGMRCVASQSYAVIGNWSCLGVLGRNWRPMVPGVICPDISPRAFHQAGGRSRSPIR
jgi:hypothetical protein